MCIHVACLRALHHHTLQKERENFRIQPRKVTPTILHRVTLHTGLYPQIRAHSRRPARAGQGPESDRDRKVDEVLSATKVSTWVTSFKGRGLAGRVLETVRLESHDRETAGFGGSRPRKGGV